MSDQTQDNIFAGTTNQEAPAEQNTNDSIANLLGTIRNEKGEQKYKSVEDALNGLKHAQDFIPKVKNELNAAEIELADLRAKAAKIDTLEQTLLELSQRQSESRTSGPELKAEDIEALVSRTLTQKEIQATKSNNQALVIKTLKDKFGDKAEETFYSVAAELNMSQSEINALASKSPQAVFKMLGIEQQDAQRQSSFAPTRPSINSEGFKGAPLSAVKRSDRKIELGKSVNTVEDYRESRIMVEQAHAAGMTMADFADPKVFKKHFG